MNQIKEFYKFCKILKRAENKKIELKDIMNKWEKWRKDCGMDYLDKSIKDEEREMVKEGYLDQDWIYELDKKMIKDWSRSRRFIYYLSNILWFFEDTVARNIKAAVKNISRKKHK